MKRGLGVWTLIGLEVLFIFCMLSVILFKIFGIFDFGFLSYRFFNVVASIFFTLYLIQSLLRLDKYVYILITIFSLFHFIEGIIIGFWWKTVIQGAILIVIIGIYYKSRSYVPIKIKSG